MQRHLNVNPGDGKKEGKVGGSVCVGLCVHLYGGFKARK